MGKVATPYLVSLLDVVFCNRSFGKLLVEEQAHDSHQDVIGRTRDSVGSNDVQGNEANDESSDNVGVVDFFNEFIDEVIHA